MVMADRRQSAVNRRYLAKVNLRKLKPQVEIEAEHRYRMSSEAQKTQ
jgi:hypothetical protein